MNQTYIFGAGALGQQVLKLCREAGLEIIAIIDPKKVGTFVEDLEVIDVSEVGADSRVLIAVLNNFVSMKMVVEMFKNVGVKEVITPPEVFFELGQKGIDAEWYWLSTDKKYVEQLAQDSWNFLQPYLDDYSKNTLRSILNYRCLGTIDERFVGYLSEQYFDPEIENFWKGQVQLLDGGAFDGDTISSAINFGIDLKKVYAFEPDPTNYKKLELNTSKVNFEIELFNAGLSNFDGYASFNFTSGTGTSGKTHVDSPQTSNTKVFRFDSLEPNNKVSHIKLDVEGLEVEALLGMADTIKNYNPKLALSIYHKPEDILKIPQLIMKLGKYSKFSIRNYAHQSFETIFYAQP
jgi:FkbM family methyltransferase